MNTKYIYLIIALLSLIFIISSVVYYKGTKTHESSTELQVKLIKNTTKFDKPELPDISNFTIQNVADKAPAPKKGEVFISSMAGITPLREFVKLDGRIQRQRISQLRGEPVSIIIKSGNYSLETLYEALKNSATNEFPIDNAILKKGDTYIFRLPLLIAPNASLTISGNNKIKILLSKERGTFIANAGDLFLIRTEIIGWSEKKSKPAYFKDKKDYRPFIVSWGGGAMHMAGCKVASLGYRKGKSYGISYSTCRECLEENPNIPRPTGTLIENEFLDMYYGFYSYEADDVAIIGNKYIDNAIYAIDPHDRSRRLIIARNETYGTKKKHGIIISREVDDSWIFENYTHNNHGSGIMIDRTSINNIIANNISAYNGQDGITFFESQNNISWGNKYLHNGRSGIKIRNSWNIKSINDEIVDNKGTPLDIYQADISHQKDRDFVMDPYKQKASAEVYGAKIKSSPTGVFKVGEIQSLKITKIFVTPTITPLFFGNKLSVNLSLMNQLHTDVFSVEVRPVQKNGSDKNLIGKIKKINN